MSWLLTPFLATVALCAGLVIGQKAEQDKAATHAHDVVTAIGVQHCDDTVIGYMTVDRSGVIAPHFEPGYTAAAVNKALDATPQHGVLRVCTAREQRWD